VIGCARDHAYPGEVITRLLAVATISCLACSGGGASPDAGVSDAQALPDLRLAEEDTPTTPFDEDGTPLAWPEAVELTPVSASPNRDSVIVRVPVVAEARDYRVFRLPTGVTVGLDADGGELVGGTTIYCAGFRQHSLPRAEPPEVLRDIEVADLTGATRLVVEALDRPCPFEGARGFAHHDIGVDSTEVPAEDRVSFSLHTEAEVRARFGSLVVNGHGPGVTLAAQGPTQAPRVLARTTITVTPLGRGTAPTATFFDDFAGTTQPVFVADIDDGGRAQFPMLFQSAGWSFYSYGAEHRQFWFERGQLHMAIADWEQDVFASSIATPRQPVALPSADGDYLHVTFEVASDATGRRYWWLVLCGAQTAGATMDAEGRILGSIVQTPFFYQADGRNPSVELWNCLQVFPRDGSPFTLGPDESRPESDVRVMVNTAGAPERDNVVNVSPNQYGNLDIAPASWFRQQDAAGGLVAPILDDQLLISPRTRFDFYIRRDRVVMYANGEQRLCNDLGPATLTMAEAALGFGQVLYHSTAERVEFAYDFNDRTGQRFYLENLPYVDVRSWDNVGYEEDAAPPASFDDTLCHVYAP
jgi:hypothetical protein